LSQAYKEQPSEAAVELARLRQAAEQAAGDLASARARLDAIMVDVSDLAPALKTALCVALEGAVNEVRAAETCLINAVSQVREHKIG
jgi:hypothetical protein